MTRMRIVLPAVLATLAFSGCESFQRFEAWKRETFLGEPPMQAAAPTYPMPGYQQANYQQQPAAMQTAAAVASTPARTQGYRVQPAAMPIYTGPSAKSPGLPPMAQPVAQPILVPASE
jgi:hypothetical protein